MTERRRYIVSVRLSEPQGDYGDEYAEVSIELTERERVRLGNRLDTLMADGDIDDWGMTLLPVEVGDLDGMADALVANFNPEAAAEFRQAWNDADNT